MQTRPVGRTGIEFSVVGFGTAQLQMVPHRQAVATLVRGFELGVNWIHTAPDYGGIDPWIREAIEISERDVMVLHACPPQASELPAYFEHTCHVYGTRRLSLYGLAGIEDLEFDGQNVFGSGGMVEYLQDRKAEGRLDGIYCSTHESADYVERLIESGVFDAIMLAWNPLGFHQQSHPWERLKRGRNYEDHSEFRERIFPLAAERGVGLLIMKPFAGGLLCKSKALPPHDWYANHAEPVVAGDVLRVILEQPGVCAVLPGSASVEEAEENARAGYAPLAVSSQGRQRIARAVESMRTSLCSRCGKCETSCSKSLPIPALFREAYIWTSRNETHQAAPHENYFDLQPSASLACATCTDQTCLCPQGLDIPAALARVHTRLHTLRATAQHPGPSTSQVARATTGLHQAIVLTADVPAELESGSTGLARFLVKNVGDNRWMAAQHEPTAATGIGVMWNDHLCEVVPLRNTVTPNEVAHFVFEFRPPAEAGSHTVAFCLMPLHAKHTQHATVFHAAPLAVSGNGSGGARIPYRIERLLRRGIRGAKRRLWPAPVPQPPDPRSYGVTYVEHSIPDRLRAATVYGIRLTVKNTGTLTWRAQSVDGRTVQILVCVDDIALIWVSLPQQEVAPGEQVTVHFPLRAHDEAGAHRVRIDLVHHGVTRFSDQGVEPWIVDVNVADEPWSEKTRLFELQRKHNPWRYDPFSGVAESRGGHPFPLFVARAKGCRLWDVDGNEFLDYNMGSGSTILGHADDRIQHAIREMLDSGSCPTFAHPVEMEVSRMLIEEFPSNDMVTFGKNGSDVCTIASRLARVVTKKKVILSCGFHGWQDFGLEYFQFEHCGIPYRDDRCLYKFRYNDRAEFLALYNRHKHDLAAVMIEPAGPLLDDEVGLAGEADVEFLHLVAEATRKAGALLIFDEIVTGFRYWQGSVQKATGIIPDVTCLGKALASGMPLSALLMPYRLCLEHFQFTHFHPTFRHEVYSLAAAKAAIQIYRAEPISEHIWQYGEALRQRIDTVCRDVGIAGGCTGPPFRMQFIFKEPDPARRQLKRSLLLQELFKQRIATFLCMLLPSRAHDDQTLQRTVEGFGNALDVVAHADRRGELHRCIELHLT